MTELRIFIVKIGTNDLEYLEERKECVQPTRKHIPLKLKSNKPMFSTLIPPPVAPLPPPLTINPINNNNDGPSVNKIARLSFPMNDVDERSDGIIP